MTNTTSLDRAVRGVNRELISAAELSIIVVK